MLPFCILWDVFLIYWKKKKKSKEKQNRELTNIRVNASLLCLWDIFLIYFILIFFLPGWFGWLHTIKIRGRAWPSEKKALYINSSPHIL